MAVVRPSVCPAPDHEARTEGSRKLQIGMKEACDTGELWPHLEVEISEVKGIVTS